MRLSIAIRFVLVNFCLLLSSLSTLAQNEWPQWRGPLHTGVAESADPPVEWGEDHNIKWKYDIAGLGHSTPIVWGDNLFVTTAVRTDQEVELQEEAPSADRPQGRRGRRGGRGIKPDRVVQFTTIALNRTDGSVRWQQVSREEAPHEGTHGTATWASNSPITDGTHLYAYFGSRGLYCYDFAGNLIWEKDLGKMATRRGFGEGSSPALYIDKLAINWDHEGESFVVMLDKNTGEELWRKQRDEPSSWSTPLFHSTDEGVQLIVSATNTIIGYDIESGEQMWTSTGMTLNVIPTPVIKNEIVYFMSGFRGNALQAIDLNQANGDVAGTNAIRWEYNKDTPYTPSPLLYDNRLYFLKTNDAILACLDAETGAELFTRQRLNGLQNVYSSPVGAAGRVYIVSRNGSSIVLEHGDEFKVLATNHLEDSFSASPVIVGADLYLRGEDFLYCISQ